MRREAFDAGVEGIMERAVDSTHALFGCTGAGTMFVTGDGALSYVAASDEMGRHLEEAQAKAGQGPCYEAYVYATEVISCDLHADSRRPDLPLEMLPRVRAVIGIPVSLSGSPVGTLNVYRDQPHEWDSSDISALRAYGDLVADAIGTALAAHEQSTLADQLRYALDYRVVIERGIGYLMGSHGLDAATAVCPRIASSWRRSVAATSPYLAITGVHHGQHSLLRLRGELDAASRADLRRAASAMLDLHRPQLLVLDLSALTFADCAGLAVIAWIHRRQEEQGHRLLITGVQPIVQRLLRLSGLAAHLQVDTAGNGMLPHLPG